MQIELNSADFALRGFNAYKIEKSTFYAIEIRVIGGTNLKFTMDANEFNLIKKTINEVKP